MYRLSNRGLSATQDLPQSILPTWGPFGGAVDCRAYMTWLTTPECWKYSTSAWEQIAAFPRPTSAIITPPPAVGEALSTVPAPYTSGEAEAAVSESIAAGKAGTDQNIADFFGLVPNVPGEAPGIPWWMWAIGAGGLVLVAGSFAGGGSARRYGR